MNIEILLTPDDLAKRWQVSRAFVYKLVREKKIPYFHIGKSIRFSPGQISERLEAMANGEYHRDRLKRQPQKPVDGSKDGDHDDQFGE